MSPTLSGQDPERFLPLRPVDFQILLVLAEGPRHGYGISKAVKEQSEGKVTLELGSLYRLVARLLDSGLLEETTEESGGEAPGEQRRYYGITPLGRRVAEAEAHRLNEVVRLARNRRFLSSA